MFNVGDPVGIDKDGRIVPSTECIYGAVGKISSISDNNITILLDEAVCSIITYITHPREFDIFEDLIYEK